MEPQRIIKFDANSNAYVIRDRQSVVTAVLHTQGPVPVNAGTALDAAEIYLLANARLLGLNATEFGNLRLSPQEDPNENGVEYRFLSEKAQFDITTVTFQQTCLGLPVWQAGISVHLKRLTNHFEVICVQSNRHEKMERDRVKVPDETWKKLKSLDPKILAKKLGIEDKAILFDIDSLRINYQPLMVYRYNREKTPRAPQDASDSSNVLQVPLPIPEDIADGSDNFVSAVYFHLSRKGRAPTHWLALVEAKTLSVLYLEEYAGGVNGKIFQADPMTTHGGPPPSAPDEQLNDLRVSMVLPNLGPPDFSDPSQPKQKLIGSNVQIANFDFPDNRSPTEAPGNAFEFNVRTNDFACVSAYYNCDRFFRLVADLGFKLEDYFPGTTFPLKVDARGRPTVGGDENSVNAQCIGDTFQRPDGRIVGGIKHVIFCLAQADASPPIGIACDWRVVLHELGGHGTLQNHVNSSFLLFTHTAGDSLAAILNDPESKARDKGRTFPWIAEFDRRHDRCVTDGWSWDGERDVNDDGFQFDREQILSSTHFQLYKAIGGASEQVGVRRCAARFTAYLILRAIQTLTPATNPRHAAEWLCSLIVADAGDWTSEGRPGGAYEKVIYWAFQKQNLFGGFPPDVDVYIDDGRGGDYRYQEDHTNCPAIWNRRANDGGEEHEEPQPGAVNFAFVKINNRGRQVATSVVVNAFQNKSQTSRNFPDDWAPMRTSRLLAPDVPPQSPDVKVGPFEWIPSAGDNYILVAVSANGDASNLGKFAEGRSIPDRRLVPHDNNLGMRKV